MVWCPNLGSRVCRRAIQISRTRNTLCASLPAQTLSACHIHENGLRRWRLIISLTQSDCRCCSSPFDQLSVIVITRQGCIQCLSKQSFVHRHASVIATALWRTFRCTPLGRIIIFAFQTDQILAFGQRNLNLTHGEIAKKVTSSTSLHKRTN